GYTRRDGCDGERDGERRAPGPPRGDHGRRPPRTARLAGGPRRGRAERPHRPEGAASRGPGRGGRPPRGGDLRRRRLERRPSRGAMDTVDSVERDESNDDP